MEIKIAVERDEPDKFVQVVRRIELNGEKFALVRDFDGLYGVTHIATGRAAIHMIWIGKIDCMKAFHEKMNAFPGDINELAAKYPVINQLEPA